MNRPARYELFLRIEDLLSQLLVERESELQKNAILLGFSRSAEVPKEHWLRQQYTQDWESVQGVVQLAYQLATKEVDCRYVK